MDIGESLGYIFEDESWPTKVLIGGLVSAIPIANLAAVGYALRVLRNVAAGDAHPLPDWSDFGGYFVKGLSLLVAGLVYAIPAISLGALAAIIYALSVASGEPAVAGVLAIGGLASLAIVYLLLVSLWLPAATARYSTSGELGAFFDLAGIWGLVSHNLGGYVVALLVTWLAGLIAGAVGSILCFVGAAFTGFWASLVYAYVLGHWLRQGRQVLPAG